MDAPVRSRLIRFGVAVTLEVLLVAALKFFDDWTLAQMPVRFVASALIGGIVFFAAVINFPDWTSFRSQKIIFWTVAVVLRLAALPLEPGDDFWRYQWEGKIQRAGFNPYVIAPDDPQLESIRAKFPAWDKINHRDFRAIYPPGAELLFAGLSRISDSPLLYKFLFAAADLATIALLLRLLPVAAVYDHRSQPISERTLLDGPGPALQLYAASAWYAWDPLVVYSFAGAADFDSLMI